MKLIGIILLINTFVFGHGNFVLSNSYKKIDNRSFTNQIRSESNEKIIKGLVKRIQDLELEIEELKQEQGKNNNPYINILNKD